MFCVEAADIVTLIIGFVKFATPGMSASWGHHTIAFLYGLFCCLLVLTFGLISANFTAVMTARGLQEDVTIDDFATVENISKMTFFIVVLDVCTDGPVFLSNLFFHTGNIPHYELSPQLWIDLAWGVHVLQG